MVFVFSGMIFLSPKVAFMFPGWLLGAFGDFLVPVEDFWVLWVAFIFLEWRCPLSVWHWFLPGGFGSPQGGSWAAPPLLLLVPPGVFPGLPPVPFVPSRR